MATPQEDLEQATALVAKVYPGADCLPAAALTVEIGIRLGYELDARPVSMFAVTPDGDSVATGHLGREFGGQFLRGHGATDVAVGGLFTGGTIFQQRAGHMIVRSEEHRLLLDPTFSQFVQLGAAATPLFISKSDALAGGRYWESKDSSLYVRYFAADDFMELDFDQTRVAAHAKADEIANHIRR
ncbi:hypothetical protein [Curtobacterium flaccumfaciens]|uniref:hypothetical protein n=1 Tax=Curtobacterium flaccumfaciens TaxID=2035 RepID=UPI003CF6E541